MELYNNNNNNIYRGSPTRQGGFQWGPHKLMGGFGN